MQRAAAVLLMAMAMASAGTSVAAGGSLHFRSAPGGAGPDLSTVDAVRTNIRVFALRSVATPVLSPRC